MTKLTMHNQKNYYHLTYGQNYKDPEAPCWGFTRLQDMFDELNRIGENRVLIELYILDDNTRPIFIKFWNRIHRTARKNGFIIKVKENENNLNGFKSIGMMERKKV
jgi:hypothetical protein